MNRDNDFNGWTDAELRAEIERLRVEMDKLNAEIKPTLQDELKFLDLVERERDLLSAVVRRR